MDQLSKQGAFARSRKSVPEDYIQKTWIPEGAREYAKFKAVTQENQKLIEFLKTHAPVEDDDLVLDVGGRDGNVAFGIQKPGFVHIVDPDPYVRPIATPARFWRSKIQDVEFDQSDAYALIICCHVLGYLGFQGSQRNVLWSLLGRLKHGGKLVLFYNLNTGYVEELLNYAGKVLQFSHYDYFDEHLIFECQSRSYEIKQIDMSFSIRYESFDELARCCWFLFGAIDPDIDGCAARFLPKLKTDLLRPEFVLDQRVLVITRRPYSMIFG